MAVFKFGNVTISSSDVDANTSGTEQAAEVSGATINGGVFGGENYGIKGGVFHGAVHIDTNDQ
ncbi:hypothetical protein [Streptomyces sp. NPDC102437]|uniref:hypothetical protein n=1 Tax=Streptomyces sp. NPDC102437 TaxID=3366175 RepID=UPI00382718DA